MKKTITVLFLVLTVMAAACSSGSSESKDEKTASKSTKFALVGTWNAKELSYVSKKDRNRTQDIKKMLNASITMTIQANGHYSYKVNMMGMTKTESGTMKRDGNRIIMDNPDFKMTLAGKTLTLTNDNQSWDFGQGKEPALSKAVFVRK
ncbi:MAG: hypothetical protein ACE5HS_05560 [bacterium]